MKPSLAPAAAADSARPVLPTEGWHVLHLFYHVDQAQWAVLGEDERRAAKTTFSELVGEIRATPDTQLLTFAMATPKADLGLMLLTPDLQVANRFEKMLTLGLGAEILQPSYSYLSLTEGSEYTTTAGQHAATLRDERKLDPAGPEFAAAMAEFEQRMAHYRHHRLYPVLPDWPVVCFYNMSKKREGADNWYSLDFETRRRLMGGHARTGMAYKGRVLQLISGSTGLDDAEWGVTLLAHTTSDIKSIVYEMRFDEVSARYGVFGEFYIGLQLPLDELFQRLCL
jgi:hydrogen peroxide-dependent heme synthase